jgi:hypothetical protein
MPREQFCNVLETAVVLLALTNAFSVFAAIYMISIARGLIGADRPLPPHPRWIGLVARVLRASP